jgi:hypothetical protein
MTDRSGGRGSRGLRIEERRWPGALNYDGMVKAEGQKGMKMEDKTSNSEP